MIIMDAYNIIIQPWLTEKSMEARSSHSRLEFIVHRSATKKQIARAVETLFEVEVARKESQNKPVKYPISGAHQPPSETI